MNTLGRTWVLPNWCLSWLTCWRRTFKAEPQDCRPCWRLGRFLETSWERWNFVRVLEWWMVLLPQPPDWNMSHLVGAPKSSVLVILVATLRQQAVGYFFMIHACRSRNCLCLKSPLDRKTPYFWKRTWARICTHTLELCGWAFLMEDKRAFAALSTSLQDVAKRRGVPLEKKQPLDLLKAQRAGKIRRSQMEQSKLSSFDHPQKGPYQMTDTSLFAEYCGGSLFLVSHLIPSEDFQSL